MSLFGGCRRLQCISHRFGQLRELLPYRKQFPFFGNARSARLSHRLLKLRLAHIQYQEFVGRFHPLSSRFKTAYGVVDKCGVRGRCHNVMQIPLSMPIRLL
jgi:hypothetical protein